MKSSSTKSNILTISTDRVLQKLTNRSSTKLSDTDNAIYDKEKEHTNCNTYHTERCSKAEKVNKSTVEIIAYKKKVLAELISSFNCFIIQILNGTIT